MAVTTIARDGRIAANRLRRTCAARDGRATSRRRKNQVLAKRSRRNGRRRRRPALVVRVKLTAAARRQRWRPVMCRRRRRGHRDNGARVGAAGSTHCHGGILFVFPSSLYLTPPKFQSNRYLSHHGVEKYHTIHMDDSKRNSMKKNEFKTHSKGFRYLTRG